MKRQTATSSENLTRKRRLRSSETPGAEAKLRSSLRLEHMQDSDLYYEYLSSKLVFPKDSIGLFYHPGHGYPFVESSFLYHNIVPGILDLSDKARFSRLIQGPGIPYSTIYHPQSSDTSMVRFPCLAKPPNRGSGQGIEVIRTEDDLTHLRSSRVLSEYVEHPRCHHGAKADVRMYVLLQPHARKAYLYHDGIVRVSTVPYQSMDTSCDPLVHITNNQIHKKRAGHMNLLFTQWIPKPEERQQVLTRLAAILRRIFVALLQKHPPSDPRCFSILGFDVLVDEFLQPWVLEFNVDWDSGITNALWGSVSLPMFESFLALVISAQQQKPKVRRKKKAVSEQTLSDVFLVPPIKIDLLEAQKPSQAP